MSARRDDGYTLVEVLVSIGVVGVVMAALGLFFLQTTTAGRRQADEQTAAQLTMAAMEQVSLLNGAALLQGRTQAAVQAQWRAPGVEAYLAAGETELVWSAEPAGPGAAALPTAPEPVLIAGSPSKFSRSWYVGACWQPRRAGECVVVPASQRPSRVPMYRVVIAVTWRSKDCASGLCSYTTATLVGAEQQDPTFS
ncbi:type II secretion system protein [Spirilliplanes yamanashiensis]|uniref:Uncharacterized protein n=1 Tax=Spirilliplanes yamanashiensis TaxID=42233 RepID=A0A8J3YBJ5_9ACTN|nr:type II secretion system protein [Spirilliplanes yamanashiensis]MDP9818059.1 prepilin-type N-terminal cleavage/methylation domain-containing protein [Spirilliplanes yamanashiensis]GIJ04869.1 hypothetical protein Sya03_42210 [Spirilliplanes yamanashiensis]